MLVCRCHFSGIRKEPRTVPGFRSEIRNCDSCLQIRYRLCWQNKKGLPPGTSPNPLPLRLQMAFKCAVVVSTIAVKRSKQSRGTWGWNEWRTNGVFWIPPGAGGGREGGQSDWSLLNSRLLPPNISRRSHSWHLCLFPASGRNHARLPVSGPRPKTVIPVCESGIGYVGKTRMVFLPVPPPTLFHCTSKWRSSENGLIVGTPARGSHTARGFR